MKTNRTVLLSFVLYALFARAMIAMYDAQTQFAEVLRNPEPPWSLTINFTPVAVFLLIGGVISWFLYSKKKKKRSSISALLLLPPEFEEQDEREKMMTARACRSSYISLYFAVPLTAALMLFYPLLEDKVPFYPILVILLIPAIQMLSYYLSIRKSL
ncbi:hypothetical protein [Bacillus infantis]|uniref:hypothetical protein n=1 Tax=Bacillus infantis TaxID=324767 RepID=UPI002155C005|nr:hypothetical protein [Bacillus infantis]MCR6611348.1 hypothetical protein [Bacillus infantis]